MKTSLYFLLVLLTSVVIAQDMKPEDTEVWEPEPRVVTPGTNTSPPSDAIVLFGQDADLEKNWILPEVNNWSVSKNVLQITANEDQIDSIQTLVSRQSFGDMQLHVEWKSPAEIIGEGQRRGNSGIFLQMRYELQVLDSYENRTYSNGQAASIYKQAVPLVNACRQPGQWQTYDIIYTAPRFTQDGELESPAYVSVLQNGILVQNHFEIQGPIRWIGYPEYEAHPLKQQLGLQDHGDAVAYRNIWVREL